MSRKIAILGTTPSSTEAPFDDKSWEIWGVSVRGKHVTRADRWFELHSFETEDDEWVETWKKKLEKWTEDCELWGIDRYPIEHIKKKFGTFFLTSTMAWMIALAIDEGADEIGLWGADMEHGDEYIHQRAGVKHFIELARFAGIKMTVPGFNGIAYNPIPYPMWQDDPLVQKVDWREKLLKSDLESLTEKQSQAEKRLYEIAAEYKALTTPRNVPEYLKELDKEAAELDAQLPKLAMDVAGCTGQLRATQWQRNFLKP